jgi:hypothetical protein
MDKQQWVWQIELVPTGVTKTYIKSSLKLNGKCYAMISYSEEHPLWLSNLHKLTYKCGPKTNTFYTFTNYLFLNCYYNHYVVLRKLPYLITWQWSTLYVANVAKIEIVFLHWIKPRAITLYIRHCIWEQWESTSTWIVDKLVTSLLRKWTLNVLVHLLESSSFSTPSQHRSHPLKL